MPGPEEAENRLRELMDLVHFSEDVALKVHGAAGAAEVLRLTNEAFAASPRYFASVLLLNEDRTRLIVTGPASYLPLQDRAAAELASGYEIELGRSLILNRVVLKRQAQLVDLMMVLADLLPAPLFSLVAKTGYTREKRSLALAPLERAGEVSGVLAVLAPGLTDYYLPTAVNLARHIGQAMEKAGLIESQYRQAERAKADKLESVGALAGGIAHDFNNLLTGILGNISLAKTYLSPGDKAYGLLAESEQSSLRAKELTARLLPLAPGGSPLKQESRVAVLIRDWVKYSLRGSQVRSTFSLPEDLWLVEVDRVQFGQVISNLVVNADQAMQGAGSIVITAENSDVVREQVPGLTAGRYVKISVTDQGPGIPREHLDRIFDPFFTTGEPGRGLGLTIAYSIIRRHGGHVTVDSEPGAGTTFAIYLPAAGLEPAPE